MTWKYVKARKPWGRPQVMHIIEQQRVAQSRGIAEIVAGLKETRIAKKFRDLTLQQAAVAAMYSASIESDLPTEAVFQQMGAGNMPPGAAAAQYAADYLGAISQYAGRSRNMMIDGVRIPHFFPGTRLQIRQVGAPSGVGQEFEQSVLRYIAAILGVSYEELSRDFTKTNYSSARAAMVQTWRFMQSRKKIVADRMANFVFLLWLEEMFNIGGIDSLPRNAPNFYDPLMREAYGSATWIGAARGQIDELKETQAAVLRIKYGLSTHEDELSKLGKDWRKVYAQLEREKKEREKRGIELVEDNMQNAMTGAPREKEASEDEGENKTNAE
jgi:lambda family phage portal protein